MGVGGKWAEQYRMADFVPSAFGAIPRGQNAFPACFVVGFMVRLAHLLVVIGILRSERKTRVASTDRIDW